MRREVLICLLLAGITLGLYWPAMQCDFISCDDPVYVTENAHVQSGLTLANIEWAFLNPVSANWHPLTMLSHTLDCQLFGLKPWGHHLTNVLLHTLNTVLVFLLLHGLTRLRSEATAGQAGLRTEASPPSTLNSQPSTAPWRSAAVAALFGWHPLHVESVAWVAERKDVLSGMFFMLTLLAYARYVQKAETGNLKAESRKQKAEIGGHFPPSIFYLLSLACFALGLMSKAMLVTLPFVLLLLDYWPLQRFTIYDLRFTISPPAPGSGATSVLRPPSSGFRFPVSAFPLSRFPLFRPLFLEKLPFFALAAAACVVTYAVQHQGGAVMTTESFPLGARLGNALISYCRYLGKLFWPAHLAIFYPHPGSWPLEEVLLAGVFLCGVSVWFFIQRNRQPWLLMGWLWFLGTLVPVIGLVQVGEQSMADRYLYIPSLGVFMVIVWGAAGIWGATEGNEGNEGKNARIRTLIRSSRREEAPFEIRKVRASSRRLLQGSSWLVGSASLIFCCLITRQQLGYWQNSESLFRHAVAVTENNGLALNNLGQAVLNRGQADEAINYIQQALRLKPAAAELHNNLGIALLAKGRTEEAIAESQEAIRLKPDFARAHLNLGSAFFRRGRLDQAIAELQEGVRLEPDALAGHVNLGVALLNRGRLDEAIAELVTAVRLKPDGGDARYNLGVAYLKHGQPDEAISQLQEALRLNPGDTDAQRDLARALEFKKR